MQLTLDLTPVGKAASEGLVVPDQGVRGARCVACPECRAEVGAPCKRPSGHAYYGAAEGACHTERWKLAERCRITGLACALCSVPDGPDHYVAPVLDGPEARAMGLAGVEACGACVEARAEAAGQAYTAYFGYRGDP